MLCGWKGDETNLTAKIVSMNHWIFLVLELIPSRDEKAKPRDIFMIYGTKILDKKKQMARFILIKALYGTFLTTLNRTNAILFQKINEQWWNRNDVFEFNES